MTDVTMAHQPAAAALWKPRTRFQIVSTRLLHSRHAVVGMTLVAFVAFIALAGPVISPSDPLEMAMADQFQAPSLQHLFGTDEFGRDILSRVIHGSRLSLRVGLLATALSLVVGTLIGLITGFYGGWTDLIGQRVVDVLLSLPGLLLALAVVAILGPGLQNLLLALGIAGIPYYARLVRGQVLEIKSREYVAAARVVGCRDGRVILRHILPNTLSILIVVASLDLAGNILAASGLSFVGLGAQPPSPEWGAMLSNGRDFMREQWWISTFPGVAIAVTVLGFNLLGDGLRDVLDPRGLD